MLTRSSLLAALALIAACGDSSSGADGQACTTIGCVDGFSVNVASTGTWKPGNYLVTVVADGVTTTCSATFPLTGAAAQCSGSGVVVGLSGSALPAEQQSIPNVAIQSTPKSVKVEIARDGASLGSQTFTPTYKTSQPNGPNCAPTCTQASDTLTVTL